MHRFAPRIFILLAVILLADTALAHPEDEFCVPGEAGLDPALCQMLSELDNPDGKMVFPDVTGRSVMSTLGLYLSIGVNHILPGGLDHILFVLAMFLAATTLAALVWQVSAFTVAHTVTLGLAAAGVIAPSPAIVEPLIALTIGFVAVENLVFREMRRWRPLVVFLFGLVHGMGFAGFFGELGLPPGQFWSALIGFNIGVEIGQLAVIAAALTVAWLIRRQMPETERARLYRRYVVLPGSVLIGAAGFWWAAERIFLT